MLCKESLESLLYLLCGFPSGMLSKVFLSLVLGEAGSVRMSLSGVGSFEFASSGYDEDFVEQVDRD